MSEGESGPPQPPSRQPTAPPSPFAEAVATNNLSFLFFYYHFHSIIFFLAMTSLHDQLTFLKAAETK